MSREYVKETKGISFKILFVILLSSLANASEGPYIYYKDPVITHIFESESDVTNLLLEIDANQIVHVMFTVKSMIMSICILKYSSGGRRVRLMPRRQAGSTS